MDPTDRGGVRQRRRFTFAARTLVATVAVTLFLPAAMAWAAPPQKLPGSAPAADLRWQPALDYDTDGCYSSPAIGPDGTLNGGLKNSGSVSGGCHDNSDLDNTNAYSRSKCNNGWCAYMYGSYFEKDQAVGGVDCCGHRHDWEHIVVWVNNDQVQYVSRSIHGSYTTYARSAVAFEGTHPKMVYHKDGASTHQFRLAGFTEVPENGYGTWQYPTLVGWDNYPPGVRDKLTSANFGSANLALKNGNFEADLAKALPSGIPFNPNA
ncbi:MAG TPA: NPP1 family protein [Kineosporiaceae bacterium]|nr:NPP1 family protein [Kineosporiaceae bacterium]